MVNVSKIFDVQRVHRDFRSALHNCLNPETIETLPIVHLPYGTASVPLVVAKGGKIDEISTVVH